MQPTTEGLVHVRVPTYKRPELLTRALQSLRQQTWPNWVCDIYDDDPESGGSEVCRSLNDPRIRYTQNKPQKYASLNIDNGFSARNPHGADYFCVLEDDNYLLPRYLEDNIALLHEHKVNLILRNQLIEFNSTVEVPTLSDYGVLDHLLKEGIYTPEVFRLSLLMGIGVSNGGLFWSKATRSALEIGYASNAVLQEYLRTFAINEPIYVAMTPLAVWMENEAATTRNAGAKASYLKRELDLKRSVQILQQRAWKLAPKDRRRAFLTDAAFAPDVESREKGLVKAQIVYGFPKALPLRLSAELCLRSWFIRFGGKTTPDFDRFIEKCL